MESSVKNPKSATPVKDSHGLISKFAENLNPNVSNSSPAKKPTNSPLTKSAKSQKSAAKNPVVSRNPVLYSPRNKMRERKFVVAKRNTKKVANLSVDCKCKERFGENVNKCLCVAYESLRASQEEFFKNRNNDEEKGKSEGDKICDDRTENEAEEVESLMAQKLEIEDGFQPESQNCEEIEESGKIGISMVKRRREKLLEVARNSVPECGRVKHLVKAFEDMQLVKASEDIPDSEELDKKGEEKIEEERKKAMQWALPGLQHSQLAETQTQVSSSSFCPSDLFLTSENLGLDPRISVSSSWDSCQGRTSNGGRRSRRSSTESCGKMGGRRWKTKQLKATSQKPFKLRTEQRGRLKEEEFTKKIQEMMVEDERQRIPIAQGLPWTTDEPECLIKPTVKEITIPIDLKLHSDIRAVERAEFDNQVAEKLNQIEQYKMERERLQKMEEEEEIRRVRKELVPKAQPMPYFDRPFIPRRSTKHPTVPREPKFHIPHQKKIKCCLSWNDMSTYTYQQ